MEIQTERMVLRQFTSSDKDIQAIYDILSDEEVNQYLPLFLYEINKKRKTIILTESTLCMKIIQATILRFV